MGILSKLRLKPKPVADPFGETHRTMTYAMTIEAWAYLPKERRHEIIEWSKQNLWNDRLAYQVLSRLRNGEIKA